MDVDQIATLMLAVIHDWTTFGAVAGCIALVNLLTNLSKLKFLADKIPTTIRPWIAVVLGSAGGVLTALVAGKGVALALVSGVVVGLAAIGGHEVISSFKAGEAAKAEAAKAVTSAVKGTEAEVQVKVGELKAKLDAAAAIPVEKDRLKALSALANKT